MKKVFVFLMVVAMATFCEAKVKLPQFFQSGMVMQRGKPIPVWGKADSGQQVTLRFNKKSYQTVADAQGKWRIDLPAMKAGGPYTLEIAEGDTLRDILVGDVWLCSGQSNIDVTVERVYPQYCQDIDSYENNRIRLFRIQNETDTHGVRDDISPTSINWKPLTKENAWKFSAIGYFLGRRMAEQTGVPQGIIVNSWGGTPIEAWISADSLQQDFPLLVKRTQYYQDDELVKNIQQTAQRSDQRWNQLLDGSDPGLVQQWTSPDYDDSSWQQVDQYDNEWGRNTGSVWLRQHINIDKTHAGQKARLWLGTLYDWDITYVNGREVGRTYYQYPPRRYDIPEGLLHEGDNVIAIRFINKYGRAYFINEKPYRLAFGADRMSLSPAPTDTIALSRTWKMKKGSVMIPHPGGGVSLQNQPSTLYNAVLHPLAPFALSGVVWYQGESNTGNPYTYDTLLRKMMGNWRSLWQQADLPFVIVQLANYMAPSATPQNSNWARLREAQRIVAKNDPRTALCVINDLGETVDIHPLRKKEVAERIGCCFDKLVYQKKKVQLSPEVIKATRIGDQIILSLDQQVANGPVYEFEVAGPDGKFENVEASADGQTICLKWPATRAATKVRYAWKDNPLRANVRSAGGWPMSSFEWQL